MSRKYLDDTGLSYLWGKINTKKQDKLVSGTNIKTINNTSLLGSGNISISGGASVWGSITGTLSDQTDLNTALDGKQAKFWEGTLAQYNAIATKDPDTYYAITDDVIMTEYQPLLVSGTNIKTINNESILGSGNIEIQGGGSSTDVQINGTSIVSNNTANILTNTAYNASTNKIATMSDIPSISGKLDTSKVKNSNSTTAGDVYDVTYINTMLGDVESLLGGI